MEVMYGSPYRFFPTLDHIKTVSCFLYCVSIHRLKGTMKHLKKQYFYIHYTHDIKQNKNYHMSQVVKFFNKNKAPTKNYVLALKVKLIII